MQTSQRRIPVGGDGGKFKTWEEMIPVYEDELNSLKSNIVKLTSPDDANSKNEKYPKAVNADVKLISNYKTVTLTKGAKLFENRDEAIDSLAPELEGLKALVLNRDTTRIVGGKVEFETSKPVKMLVGFLHRRPEQVCQSSKSSRPTLPATSSDRLRR